LVIAWLRRTDGERPRYIVKPVDVQQFTDAVRNPGLYWLLLNEPPRIYPQPV